MKITPNDEPLRFDGDNSYPDCTCCGQCCGLNVLAITPEELDAMHECIERKHVRPIDRKGERCPLQSPEGGCMIWEALKFSFPSIFVGMGLSLVMMLVVSYAQKPPAQLPAWMD